MSINNKILQGEQIYLRPIIREDTDLIIQWRNSDGVRPYFIYQQPFTREGHLHWMETMIDTEEGFQFIVCRNEDDKPIGCTYLRDYDRKNNKIEYGVFIGEPEAKGKGYGLQMLELTLDFAFDTLKVHKVFARAFADNAASVNCFLKGGFTKEAHLVDEVCINGTYRDIVLLAKINEKNFMRSHE